MHATFSIFKLQKHAENQAKASSAAETWLKGVENELKGVKKWNTYLKYRMAKRDGDLKLKSEELWRRDQTLAAVTMGSKDQLE